MTAPMDLCISLVLAVNRAVKLNLVLKRVSGTHNINLADPHPQERKRVVIGLGLWTKSAKPKQFSNKRQYLLLLSPSNAASSSTQVLPAKLGMF